MSEINGGSEVSESTEVNDVPSEETGGEASEATQEAVNEEVNESGGFEDMDNTETPEEFTEEYGESDIEEPDEKQEIGFSEDDNVENSDYQNNESEYGEGITLNDDEDNIGFDEQDIDAEDDESIDVSEDDADNIEDSDSDVDDIDNDLDSDEQDNDDDLGVPEDYSSDDSHEDSLEDDADNDFDNDEGIDVSEDDADNIEDSDSDVDDIDNDLDLDEQDNDDDLGVPEDYSSDDGTNISLDQNNEQRKGANLKLDNSNENFDNEDAHSAAIYNMTKYMSEHNYGPDDYAKYSKDPEWQKLNGDLQKSLGKESEEVTTPSPENHKDISTSELPDNCVMVNASDIDMTYARGMDSDQFWDHHTNTKQDYLRIAEKIPDVQQALNSGKSLDEIRQDSNLKDTVNAYFDPENMVKVEEKDDGSYSFTDDGRHRISAAQELGVEIPVEVINKSKTFITDNNLDTNTGGERIEGMMYAQGNNKLGYQQTCGPTTLANSLNRITDTNRFTENDMVKAAAENKLCSTSGSPENCGLTDTEDIVKLADVVVSPEENITTEVYEYDEALSVDELASRLKDPNTVAMVGVDSCTLWDTDKDVTNSSLFNNDGSVYSDHWIMVDGPEFGEDGNLKGFKIVDSGGGESFVDRDKFESMYIGNDNFQINDPTSIIISRSDSNAIAPHMDVQPKDASLPKDNSFIAEQTDLSPPEANSKDEDFDLTRMDKEIPVKDISDMPENVQHSYEQYENAGWPNVPKLPEQTSGTHASGTWKNKNGDLPTTTSDGTAITYREHDVNNKSAGIIRDAQRFVTGSDGSVYYTDDHYSTFTKLK